jgi:hypothetical protein
MNPQETNVFETFLLPAVMSTQNQYVHAQSMFCAHFLFKFVSFLCLFISVYFIAFFWHYSWFVCALSGVSQVLQGSYLHLIVYKQGCIYIDPIYYLFISELFQCSLLYVFFAICSLAMIAFNFKVLRIAFNIKPLSASNWGTRPHKMHGTFHDVIDTRYHTRVISFKGLFRGYLLCAKNASTAVQHLAPLLRLLAWPEASLCGRVRCIHHLAEVSWCKNHHSVASRTIPLFQKCNNTFIGQLTQGWHCTTRAICSKEQI